MSLLLFLYSVYIKINTLDIFYYRVESFDYNDEVTFYRHEIESAFELLDNMIYIAILCSLVLLIIGIYELRRK